MLDKVFFSSLTLLSFLLGLYFLFQVAESLEEGRYFGGFFFMLIGLVLLRLSVNFASIFGLSRKESES